MKQIFLQILKDSTTSVTAIRQSGLLSNYWFWITTAEFVVILFLFYKLRKNKTKFFLPQENQNVPLTKDNVLQNSKDTEIDMDDLMDSIHKSKDLYKQLSTKCHPDRFINKDLNKKANMIFQEITRNQRNYKRLLELKKVAQTQLNITI